MSVQPPASTNDRRVEAFDYQPAAEQSYVDILRICFGDKWGDVEYWRRKHLLRPGFDPRDAKQFRVDAVPACCDHVSIVSLCLEPNLFVEAGVGGDLAVMPQFRGQGLMERVFGALSRELYERGAVVRYGFTSPTLHERVYKKRLGYVLAPTATATYRKTLSSSLLAEQVLAYANQLRTRNLVRRMLRQGPLMVAIRVPRYEPCVFAITPDSVSSTSVPGHIDVDITLPYRALAAARAHSRRLVLILLSSLARGEFRIKGVWGSIRRLL